MSREDFIAGKVENRYNCKEFKSDLFVRTYLAPFILLLASAFVLKKGLLFYLEVYILFIILFPTIYKERLLKKIRKKASYTIYKFSVTLGDDGIEYATYTYKINIKWSSVTGIVETDQYLHIYTDSKEEIFIPKKIFINEEEKNQFITELTNFSNNIIKKLIIRQ